MLGNDSPLARQRSATRAPPG